MHGALISLKIHLWVPLKRSGKPYLANVKVVIMEFTFSQELFIVIIIRVFCPRAGPSLQVQEPRLQF